MGYSHYWRIKKQHSIPAVAQDVLREVLGRAYRAGVIQLEFNQAEPPLISDRLIRFNGVGESGHETFAFDMDDRYRDQEGGRFAFCKTAQKPYDAYVMKTLLVLKHFMPEAFTLSSDGDFDVEWQDARRWCEAHLSVRTYIQQELVIG